MAHNFNQRGAGCNLQKHGWKTAYAGKSLELPHSCKTAMTAAMTQLSYPHSILRPAGASISSSDIPEVHTEAIALVLESAAVTKDMKVASTNIGNTQLSQGKHLEKFIYNGFCP